MSFSSLCAVGLCLHLPGQVDPIEMGGASQVAGPFQTLFEGKPGRAWLGQQQENVQPNAFCPEQSPSQVLPLDNVSICCLSFLLGLTLWW